LTSHEAAGAPAGTGGRGAPVIAELSTLDRYLPVWIGLAMAGGLLLGRLIPDLNEKLERIKIDTVSLPIAIGLLAMMYPVLAKRSATATSATSGATGARCGCPWPSTG